MRIALAALLVLLFVGPALGQSRGRSSADVNFLIISMDDMGPEYWRPTNAGSPDDLPEMDTLAAAGVRLDNFYAAPTCAMMRQAMFTGRYFTRMGATDGGGSSFNVDEEWTIGKVLQDNWGSRYDIVNIGELGIGSSSDGADPSTLGFTHFNGSLGPSRSEYWGFPERTTTATDYADAGTFTDTGDATINSIYSSTRVADQAIAWFAANNSYDEGAKNFVMYVGFYAPHTPLVDVTDDSNPDSCPLTTDACMQGMRQQAVIEMDRIIQDLPADVYAKTIILVFWDNGTANSSRLSTHTYVGGKSTMYEDGVRTGAILSGGMVASPGTVDTKLRWIGDIFATQTDYMASPALKQRVAKTANVYYNGQLRNVDAFSWRDIITEDCGAMPKCGERDFVVGTNATSPADTSRIYVKNPAGYKYMLLAGVEHLWLIASRLGTEEALTDLCETSSGTLGDCSTLTGVQLTNYTSLKAEEARAWGDR